MEKFCLLAVAATLASTAVPPADAQKQADVDEVIQTFVEKDDGMQEWFSGAHGYAIFPSVGKGGIGIGGASGKGIVYGRESESASQR